MVEKGRGDVGGAVALCVVGAGGREESSAGMLGGGSTLVEEMMTGEVEVKYPICEWWVIKGGGDLRLWRIMAS